MAKVSEQTEAIMGTYDTHGGGAASPNGEVPAPSMLVERVVEILEAHDVPEPYCHQIEAILIEYEKMEQASYEAAQKRLHLHPSSLAKALRDVGGSCSDSTSIRDAFSRLADKIAVVEERIELPDFYVWERTGTSKYGALMEANGCICSPCLTLEAAHNFVTEQHEQASTPSALAQEN